MVFLRFIYPLARDMLRNELEAKSIPSEISDLFFDVFDVIGEFIAELTADFHSLVKIFNDPDPSENNNALDIECPVAIFAVASVVNAERCFAAIIDRIDLVSGLSAVKIDVTVLLTVVVIDRHAVRISLVSDN